MHGPGAYGPYRHGRKFRVLVRGGDGEERYRSFETEEQARAYLREARKALELEGRTVSEAILMYESHHIAVGNKPRSYNETMRRLRLFFTDVLDLPLDTIRHAHGERLYETLCEYKTRASKLLSVDSRLNIFAEAKSFLEWCRGKKWVKSNALADVKAEGKRQHGKAQLRLDEARTWLREAMRMAKREPGAVAALMTVLLGMRAGEIVSRQVRDLDDKGRLLWIPDSKTPAGKRQLEVPDPIRAHLQRLAKGKGGGDLLFGHHWRDWPREWVQRICDLAGVPKVTAHGMRGLHSSLSFEAGITGHAVAAAMGHESESTTLESYADRESVERAKQKRALKVLIGGKR